MSYSVKQGDIFGRIGSAIGKGLQEQIPKEVEHQRLSSGLKQLGEESANLSPIEFLTKAYSTYGITPQMVQSLGEAAKFQRQKNAYADQSKRSRQNQLKSGNEISELISSNSSNNVGASPNFVSQQKGFSQPDSSRSLYIDSGINNYNPTRQEALPGIRATPQQIQEQAYDILASGMTDDPGEARRIAVENDERRLAMPKDQQERQAYLDSVKDDVDNRFTKELETRLQKKGENLYGDISGQQLTNLKRAVEEDLRNNPGTERDKIISKWTEIGYNFAKTKRDLSTLSNQNFFKKFSNKESNFNKLKSYSKAYAEANNSDELFNILRTPKSEDNLGFGMSDQGAAQVAYERSPKVKTFIKEAPFTNARNRTVNSRKIAESLAENLSDEDSLQAIARDLTDRDQFFDQAAFFNYFRENRDKLRLTGKQKHDLDLGEMDSPFEWGDIFYLPSKGYR